MERRTVVSRGNEPWGGLRAQLQEGVDGLFQNVSRETCSPFVLLLTEKKEVRQQKTAFDLRSAALDADSGEQDESQLSGIGLGKLARKKTEARHARVEVLCRQSCFPERLPDSIVLHWGMGH